MVERGPDGGPEALAQAGAAPEQVAAIGLDCTACTVVACDLEGKPLRPALLWMDQRSFREADAISATGDPVLRYVSGRVSPEWMLPKALWLKTNEPETYRRAGRIVECTDWMMYRLTGEWTLSLNHVAVKWNYARPDGGWPLAPAEGGGPRRPARQVARPDRAAGQGRGPARRGRRAGPGPECRDAGGPGRHRRLPRHARPGGDRRRRRRRDRRVEHLPPGPVAATGVFGSGAAGCYPDATVEGLYTIEAGQTATGSILDWYRRHFAGREQAEAERRGVNVYQVLDEQAAAVPPGAEGLIVRDDWQGNRSPYKNPQARGAIVGLSLAHGPGPRLPCPLRGHGLRHPAHPRGRRGARPGGRAGLPRRRRGRSALWLQIHADILKKPVHLTRESESCALGSAMTAAVAAGVYRDFDEAARAMVAIEKIVEPNPANAADLRRPLRPLRRAVSSAQSCLIVIRSPEKTAGTPPGAVHGRSDRG